MGLPRIYRMKKKSLVHENLITLIGCLGLALLVLVFLNWQKAAHEEPPLLDQFVQQEIRLHEERLKEKLEELLTDFSYHQALSRSQMQAELETKVKTGLDLLQSLHSLPGINPDKAMALMQSLDLAQGVNGIKLHAQNPQNRLPGLLPLSEEARRLLATRKEGMLEERGESGELMSLSDKYLTIVSAG